jgi:hypothetical protein
METQPFPTRDVLSTITGRLMGDIGGVYKVLNWMTGESVFTHQVPRICREARPVLITAHPELAITIEEAEEVTQENYLNWREAWEARYGLFLDVPKFAKAEHEAIDPLSELAEGAHPDQIIVVEK